MVAKYAWALAASRRAAAALMLALPLVLAHCGGKTLVDGTATGSGTASNECPSDPPTPGAQCHLPDFDSCTFVHGEEDEGCLQIFECQPVYPEAGAPSEWQIVTDECGQYCIVGPLCPTGYSTIQSCPSSVECIEDVDPCRGHYACIPCQPAEPGVSSACGPQGETCTLPWTGDPYCYSDFECGADGLWSSHGDVCA